MPAFTGRLIEEVPESWRKWGGLDKDNKKIQDHLAAIRILKERSRKGSGIIGAYHTQRVAPLMSYTLPLYLMAPGASLDGMALADEAPPPSKVAQRIKEAMEPSKDTASVVLDFMYSVPEQPPMRLELGYIDFISSLSPCLFFF